MAVMNIKIINPNIRLFSELSEQSNDCMSIFEFTIETTPYSTIQISAIASKSEYMYIDSYRFNYLSNGKWLLLDKDSDFLVKSGSVKVRVIMENLATRGPQGSFDLCNTLDVTITDSSHNKTESRSFTRCGEHIPCDGGISEPVANDDTYTMGIGSIKDLPILSNDSIGSYWTDVEIVIKSQPSHGTIEVLSSGEVRYTHTGTVPVVDTFTYSVINEVPLESNIATVTINIADKQVDNNTYVNILVDNSHSMSDSMDALKGMIAQGGPLHTKLSPYYDSDSDYSKMVNFYPFSGERTFRELVSRFNDSGNTINLIFQDEARDHYHNYTEEPGVGWTIDQPRTPTFEDDIKHFRSELDNKTDLNYNGVIFQLLEDNARGFNYLLKAMESGTGQYTGIYSLQDIPNINIKYDIVDKPNELDGTGTAQYYADLVVAALNELGFKIV